jgi:UDP-2,3-diacylglucosamine pyrophosphatase LpxH
VTSGTCRSARTAVIRKLTDDTLVVFLSDCHIGGDEGRNIFESPDDLVALFESLDDHAGPVQLVLAGDFFDFLRIAEVPEGETRATATMSRPEYRELFAALHRLARGQNRTVVYLPGNHDAEAWWNREIRGELERLGLAHEFALSYAASFESGADRVVYCEHGNQFDPTNTFRDYDNPLDTPLGDHVVTDLLPRLPTGWESEGGNLRDVDRVFPLAGITQWLAGRFYYVAATRIVLWLLLPLLILYAAHALVQGGGSADVLVELAYDIAVILLVFGLFLFVAGRATQRFIRSSAARAGVTDEPELIRSRLEAGKPPPLADVLTAEIGVFVSGHTHAPALTQFDGSTGRQGAIVNSGCWLRQLQPVPAHLGAPPVYVSRFVQTHVRVYWDSGAIQVELWEHPRPSHRRLRVAEWLAVVGRLPAEPDADAQPRVRVRASVDVGQSRPMTSQREGEHG